jgi:hypothetical protein
MRAGKSGAVRGAVTESKEHRRKSKRYRVTWKAAVVFDPAAGRPIFHTETQDLSSGGAAIRSDYGDLTGTHITLLLAQPGPVEQTARMLKVRAKVVSCVATPPKPGFRHGLSFVRFPDDALSALDELLKASPGEPQAPQAPAAPEAGGRLAMLKQMAQAKLSEEKKPDPQEEINRRVSDALDRVYKYLKELAEQLDVVKPAYNNKGYTIPLVPEFSGLAWSTGSADLQSHQISPTEKRVEQVSLYYRIAGKKNTRATREYPKSEKVKQMLREHKIEFRESQQKNAKGSLESETFAFDCEIKASLLLEGRFDTGKLIVKARNVEHFGAGEYLVSPEAVTPEALEQLAAFILGESSRPGPLLTKG